jgi:hypothetical protein
MMRLPVRSRNGNVVLAVIGCVYALSATGVLAWLVVDVWNASMLIDLLLQIALVAAAACGVWFTTNALENLGIPIRFHARHHDSGASNAASIHR